MDRGGKFARPCGSRLPALLFLLFVLRPFVAEAQEETTEFSRMKELVQVPMVESDRGRAMLSLVAGCALPAQEAAYGDHGGTRYVFPGELGLVPSWPDRPMTAGEQRWISACVLARRNGGSHCR